MARFGPKVNPGDRVKFKSPFWNKVIDLTNAPTGFPQGGLTGNLGILF